MPRKTPLPPLTAPPEIEAVRWYDLDELILWVDNYNEGDVGKIIGSIRRFGFAQDPKVWQGANVRGGNHTIMALRQIKRDGPQAGDLHYPPARVRVQGQQWFIACADISYLTEDDAVAFAIADNNIARQASQNNQQLIAYLEGLLFRDESAFAATGYDEDDLDYLRYVMEQGEGQDSAGAGRGAGGQSAEQARVTLAERFIVPPFSVLDARQGYWQERKRAWIALGIRGELGRGRDLALTGGDQVKTDGLDYYRQLPTNNPGSPGDTRPDPAANWQKKTRNPGVISGSPMPLDRKKNGRRAGAAFGQDLARGEHAPNSDYGYASKENVGLDMQTQRALGAYAAPGGVVVDRGEGTATGTSVFDPVLCEIAYRWFNVPGGHVLDPFAGEATKGIVATYLGYGYTGVELRPEQVDANEMQARAIGLAPTWIMGDSEQLDSILAPESRYDLIFTSPPYYDLEIYSESEKDGSAFETYEKFMVWYRHIFAQAVGHLNDNRFVVVKVGEIRDKKGAYRNFLGDNIACFLDLGLHYYNEAVLVTAVGSLPIRVGQQFTSGRKLGKAHQNILVFYKGDPRKIKEHFPLEIEYGAIEISGEADSGEGDLELYVGGGA